MSMYDLLVFFIDLLIYPFFISFMKRELNTLILLGIFLVVKIFSRITILKIALTIIESADVGDTYTSYAYVKSSFIGSVILGVFVLIVWEF